MHSHPENDLPTIVQISRIQFQLMHQFLNSIDLYPGQYHLLSLLSHNKGGINQKKIAQHLFIKPSSVNQLLVKLEEAQYITRVPDEHDKRMLNVHITKKGLDILKEAAKKFDYIQSIGQEGISEEDLAKFEQIATKIKENLLNERKGECPRCQ
jgi:DNA-binding MarR family transcriptional regulator